MVNVQSLGSLSSEDGCYSSEDSESDAESFQFGDLCPRTSSETSSTHKGFNPTFYEVDVSEDEDPSPLYRSAEFRRLNSVVEKDARLKENVQAGTRELVLNPTYGIIKREASDQGDSEVQTETKLKTLKSATKAGCLVLPVSTALVGSEYIGRTSLNPTYGDASTSGSSSEDEDLNQLLNDTGSQIHTVSHLSLERISSRSLPMSSFREMAHTGISENMGTLTWSNAAFSPQESDNEHSVKSHPILDHRWKEILRHDVSDDVEFKLRPSPFSDPSIGLQAVHFTFRNEAVGEIPAPVPHRRTNKPLITPIQPISHEGFEDITITCPPIPHTKPSRHSKQRIPVSPKGCSNFLTSGMKHTRWAIRWIYLLMGRFDGFLTNKQK